MGNSEIPPIGVRLPEELRGLIDEAAKFNSRSRNAEIVARLASSLEQQRNSLGVAESDPKPYIDKVALTEIERSFMTLFRKWRPEQQLAFLLLFKE